jgi:hypothetical protein
MTERQNIDFGIFNFDILYHSYMVYLITSTYYNKMQIIFYFDYDTFYFYRIMALENFKRTKLFHLQTIFYQLPYTGTNLRLICVVKIVPSHILCMYACISLSFFDKYKLELRGLSSHWLISLRDGEWFLAYRCILM